MNPAEHGHSRRAIAAAAVVACLVLSSRVTALSVTEAPGPDDVVLAADGQAASVFLEPNEDRAVLRAAGDLVEDIARVTGVRPTLLSGTATARGPVVIIGTLGKSRTIDGLVSVGKVDAAGIRGQWESYLLQVVKAPLPGVDRALVIAGSDRRGTIFGVYTLSEAIGVSPWTWWADVPVKQRKTLAVRPGVHRQGPPAVKFRGIFLNDEDWGLRPWAAKTLEPEVGNIGPKTYAKVFELLLRLKANYLWPAMHEGTPAFNTFPGNKDLADAYGIVMGSSHCEQMLRNNVDEWARDGQGEYDYLRNRDGVLRYWETRVQENGRTENVYTVGMRGIHDSGMPGGGTPQEQAERLHRIIADQRDLLRRWVNPDVAKVPQIFCPYKEVLALYRLAPNIPEDITLCWPDDNWGYVRQFSDAQEQRRGGGAGVYYHISYWGRPYDYLWLCSTPPALIWEELAKAWDHGARTLWVINVGDIKPAEIGTEFALRLGWDPHRWGPGNVRDYLVERLTRDFGSEPAEEMAAILWEYYRLCLQRKPEHMGLDPRNPLLARPVFSMDVRGDEAQERLESFRRLAARVDGLGRKVPGTHQDAFFQVIGYPVRAAALMNEKGLSLARFQAYAQQGRASAAGYLEQARKAHEAIQQETEAYNNRMAGGKWRHMMSAAPRNLAVFHAPTGTPPDVPDAAILGLAVEGGIAGRLPEFSRLTRQGYFIDVFDQGRRPVQWTARADEDWIRLSAKEGRGDQRIGVSIDWAKAPKGDEVQGTIRVVGAGQEIPVEVTVFHPADPEVFKDADFVEDNRTVVIEAEHASARTPGKDARWEVVHGLGYNGEAVSVFPTTAAIRSDPDPIRTESPRLQYRVWVRHPGPWKVIVRALPTWPIDSRRPHRIAVAFDQDAPVISSFPVGVDERDRTWQESVLRNASLATSTHDLGRPGLHTLNVWMVDPGLVMDTILMDGGCVQALGHGWPRETRRMGP